MKPRAFLFTTGDGRPTANAFWMPQHQKIIPRVENALREKGLEPVWLHDQSIAVSSHYMAARIGKKLLQQMQKGDLLIDLTTGWNFPEHFGIPVTMAQEAIRQGDLKLLLVCNMEEKAPGYVAARANALICEIMELSYVCLTVLEQTDACWQEFSQNLGAVLEGTYKPEIPETPIEVTDEDRRIAREAIKMTRESGGIAVLINASSMTMAQGWPNYRLFKELGLTPVFVGSNEFQADMEKVSQADLQWAFGWLRDYGLQFAFEQWGLCEAEIFQALRMYFAKLTYWQQGAVAIGTQGQMDTTRFKVATDLSESLMMSTLSPGKAEPVVDVTEVDCEALFTSVLMRNLIRTKYEKTLPIGFHDVRHYNVQRDTLVLLNSGALAFDFMTDKEGDYSDIWAVSQNRDVYFLNGGACIKGNMRPINGANMFRAHGKGPGYRMLGTYLNILPLGWRLREQDYGKLDPWPMGIAQVPGGKTKAVTLNWVPNHSHHCQADIMGPMKAACEMLGVEFYCF